MQCKFSMKDLHHARNNMNEDQDISLFNSFLMKNLLSSADFLVQQESIEREKKAFNNSQTLFEEFLITASANPLGERETKKRAGRMHRLL